MMKKKINQKGISLISLSVMVMVILAITGTIIYSVKNNLKVERLEQMQDDIENLQDKVDTYYAQYGKIPAKTDAEYTNISQMQEAGIISTAVDTGKFYVLDLSAIENLTLNFGQDYETVKSLTSENEINRYDNLYIINENSHNIFFPKGITLDEEVFYTNYRVEDVDTEAVNLRYVDNVKIPDGYHYISGNKAEGIIIQNDSTSEQYKWIVNDSEINAIPEGITVDDEAEFIKSANLFDGYYQGTTDTTKVIYLPIEEKWSDTYDKTGKYVDKYVDTATIPAGFKVSQTPGMDTISTGLVVMAPDGSEFVWVPVADINTMATKTSGQDENGKDNYQGKLYDFSGTGDSTTSTEMTDYGQGTTSYREPSLVTGNSADTYAVMDSISGTSYDADSSYYKDILGYTSSTGTIDFGKDMQKDYNAMIESVSKYGGFYIGRYETSISGETVASKVAIPMNATTDSGNTWYGMYKKQKEYTSKNNITSVKSSMIWGSQYDAMLNWALTGRDKGKVTAIGNGNHNGTGVVNTGTSTADKINNIFDLSGNLCEWTLEGFDTFARYSRGRYLRFS